MSDGREIDDSRSCVCCSRGSGSAEKQKAEKLESNWVVVKPATERIRGRNNWQRGNFGPKATGLGVLASWRLRTKIASQRTISTATCPSHFDHQESKNTSCSKCTICHDIGRMTRLGISSQVQFSLVMGSSLVPPLTDLLSSYRRILLITCC